MRQLFTLLLLFLTFTAFSQKKILDHSDLKIWNSINNATISSDGNYIMYALEKGEKDSYLKLKLNNGKLILEHERAEKGQFSYNSTDVFFTIKPWKDSIKELKRKKVKANKLPKDTLAIYNLKSGNLAKIANVKSYKIPEKWDGTVAYLLEEVQAEKKSEKKDDKSSDKKDKKAEKKVGKDTGYHLVVKDLNTTKQDTFKFVTDFVFAKEAKKLSFISTGDTLKANTGVFVLDLETNLLTKIFEIKKAKFNKLTWSENGENLAFVVDADSTKAQVRPNILYHWKKGLNTAQKLVDNANTPNKMLVSANGTVSFSKDNSKLYFGLAKQPILKDTTLLDEEIVNVEVWTYNEPSLYTVQEMQVSNDQRKSYTSVYHLESGKLVSLASEEFPNIEVVNEGNATNALLNRTLPYELESQWEGSTARDFALINVNTGETNEILKQIKGRLRLSPEGNFVYGYSVKDSSWITFDIASNKMVHLTKNKVFFDELNDSPDFPNAYGMAGWTNNDESIVLYDRYDIWEFNPKTGESVQLTDGRAQKTVYRFVDLDREEESIDKNQAWLLRIFNEDSKNAGYASLNLKNKKITQLLFGAYNYSNPIKATQANKVIFTRQSFIDFPNIWYSDLNFKKPIQMSDANPQQKNYNWGTSELVKWTSLDGIELTGLLIKPENFDASKKYPMIVNFYERSSDGLHSHRAPSYGRSTINYSFYASRGYLIFNPDIHYRIGYPGESAYNCVIPGVTSLIEKGFVDKDNIGVQGHSWGGYQIAYLVTRTNIFKAAESGAPVVNMYSAYGGIRWWTGLSRQFQYEHTQSRIGGTPWEYPLRYIENSPIFTIDKINTPLLIMHNDADGHVPWYQGIEFFTALRRLGKPAWLLNYNDEPHWPVKFQNREDFNIRMSQFFDYYLKGAPKPVWMEKGVPAIEKGINQGLEFIKE
jgi:dipeptidyl aminopeptidase/acylaminoacyl peptidase